jgi:hypothetical protein
MLARITTEDLAALIQRRIAAATGAGHRHVRDPTAFAAHLIAVAHRAQCVAVELARRLPSEAAPDPVASFVAGAWHDAGKIFNGNDYHEITSALELLEHGVEWGLVAGSPSETKAALRRAALAVLPHFALFEQLQDNYVPTSAPRGHMPALLSRLENALHASPRDTTVLLPNTMDAVVLIYSDMAGNEPIDSFEDVDEWFARRWRQIERSAMTDDPAILPILRCVRPRIRAACEVIQRLLRDDDPRWRLDNTLAHRSSGSAGCSSVP